MPFPPIIADKYLVDTGYAGVNEPNGPQTWVFPPGAVYNGPTP